MPQTPDLTTVLCLFHTHRQAQEALDELQNSEIPASSIRVLNDESDSMRGSDDRTSSRLSSLQALNLPEKHVRLLSEGIRTGGIVIVISGPETLTEKAEIIFGRHQASQVDQKIMGDTAASTPAKDGAAIIPVLEEELAVGKRQIQRGGVRLYSRVVETPVEESITLREEHATIERHRVDRAISEADLAALKIQSVEVSETAEVPVVQKTARVVEEVRLSKDISEKTQHISESVRKTEVTVEPIEADVMGNRSRGKGD